MTICWELIPTTLLLVVFWELFVLTTCWELFIFTTCWELITLTTCWELLPVKLFVFTICWELLSAILLLILFIFFKLFKKDCSSANILSSSLIDADAIKFIWASFELVASKDAKLLS